ncbi:glycerol-3-phosphate dehydrogenase/oxidase [Paenibacillus sp. ACRRX]|uniref:glycerol-3-phosphate dehydrogenase/oxidase n=1 Tax=unclassified Paenibacillus TaxID=185978 RepID=UPI001EF67687|nr:MULTISPECIES: FAD-dependent oxidoreductase [unclassified Paenibacillus]MCG7409248.1 glycerol-3-phosphate dehydrogenase/oxidase [Paenibacillus sp. ACRRX]MDK8179903.1 FAD-dependent oxidoreductase [Paenibacillus sp. UMB4589-SE434]
MLNTFSATERRSIIEGMGQQPLDVIVIGGGITGAGIALDATTRGLRTALFEMQDFAAGTSSRSTKLVHGGLRYLKQFDVKTVAEVGKERAIVYENGPHVTTPEWMLLPLHRGGTFGKFSTGIGLRVYDFLAGVKRSERRRMLAEQETLKREPLLKRDGLLGGGYYVEYRTDDARLTIEVMKEAVHHGAMAVNYMKVDSFVYENSKIVGVRVVDQLNGHAHEFRAKKIINAAGPWVDELRNKDHSKTGKHLQLSKGVHLVIDQAKFPLKQAVYFDTPDGRMVFAIPRDGKAYVGTTDTFYKADPVQPIMTKEDRDYIMGAIAYMFPTVKLTVDDIESSWAGVRPLIYEEGKNASEISRRDEIWQSPSGLITIAGGKLTGYRKMAEMIVDLVMRLLVQDDGRAFVAAKTKQMPISGGHVGGSSAFPRYIQSKVDEGVRHGLDPALAKRWVQSYGSNVDDIFKFVDRYRDQTTASGLPLEVLIPLVYAMNEELTMKPVDFFIRRTGALFFNIQWVHQWKQPVIAFMAAHLDWTPEQQTKYMKELDTCLHQAVVPQVEMAK